MTFVTFKQKLRLTSFSFYIFHIYRYTAFNDAVMYCDSNYEIMICRANELTGLYAMVTLAFSGLSKIRLSKFLVM